MMDERKEIQEAIYAGERALDSLYAAQDKLNSARSWGIFDLLGGGFFTDLIKHSKMDDAAGCMEDARYRIKVFQKELKDVDLTCNLRLEVGGFLNFADFFFDGVVADYLVQSKIAEAREQVQDAIFMVKGALDSLRRLVQ